MPMFGEDFSRFSWWRALLGAAIGVAMAFYAYGRTGNKWCWLAIPGMALVFGLEGGSGEGTGGDDDSGGGDGDGG
ncbi:MAG: hypothetical protein ACXWHB_11220 [Usitatibacter sp.]